MPEFKRLTENLENALVGKRIVRFYSADEDVAIAFSDGSYIAGTIDHQHCDETRYLYWHSQRVDPAVLLEMGVISYAELLFRQREELEAELKAHERSAEVIREQLKGL